MSQAACGLQASSGVKHEPLKATRRTPVWSARGSVSCDCLRDGVPVGALDAVPAPSSRSSRAPGIPLASAGSSTASA